MANGQKKPPIGEIVEGRIDRLLKEAKGAVKQREEDAVRYVKLARKLSMRHRVPLGGERKRMFCKKCFRPWIRGHNVEVRDEGEWKVFRCKKCGREYKAHL